MSCYTLSQSEAVRQEMARRIHRATLIINDQAGSDEIDRDQLFRAIQVLAHGEQMEDEDHCVFCEGSLEVGWHDGC